MKRVLDVVLGFSLFFVPMGCLRLPAAPMAPANVAPVSETCSSALTDFAIPRLESIRVDGDLADWSVGGFRIEVLAAEGTGRREVDRFDAKARLAWDDVGLLFALDVTDRTHVETVAYDPDISCVTDTALPTS